MEVDVAEELLVVEAEVQDVQASVELTRRCRHAAAAVGDLIFIYGGLRGGVLLDDLLVAEDLTAAETTNTASQAAAAVAVSSMQAGRTGRYGCGDEGTRRIPESVPVVLGTPVAQPTNGDMHIGISTENAMLQGPRRLSKGVDYLVEASTAEAEAISASLAVAKACPVKADLVLGRSKPIIGTPRQLELRRDSHSDGDTFKKLGRLVGSRKLSHR